MTIGSIILLIIGALLLIWSLILHIKYKERGEVFGDSAPGAPGYMIAQIFGWFFVLISFL